MLAAALALNSLREHITENTGCKKTHSIKRTHSIREHRKHARERTLAVREHIL
jgi:hypothetical protein